MRYRPFHDRWARYDGAISSHRYTGDEKAKHAGTTLWQRSKRYTCDALSSAKEIRLEYEKEKDDKYGRCLAWVFVDDELLQEKLIRKGYAKVAYLYDEYTYTGRLQKAEKEAKERELGLWDKE